MKYLLLLSFVFSIVSCKKNSTIPVDEKIPYSEASYKITVTVNWESPQFSVPPHAHVTPLIGMVHSKDTFLWNIGSYATPGLENVAEIGNNTVMNLQLDSILATGKALTKFTIPAPTITGSVDTVLNFNTNYSYISFASMIAPSPDWFMGLHDIDLFKGNKWVDSLALDIHVYDAGTEQGDVFSYDNPDTVPRDTIHLLTPQNASVLANGNSIIAPFASIKFIKN